jgi:CheY-like chemotaxis protein
VEGARQGYRTARTELADALPPHAVDSVLAAYRKEGARLAATARAVGLVERALHGEPFTSPLDGREKMSLGGGCRARGARRVIQLSRRARILLVDDRAENLIALEAILSPLEAIIVSVRSGEQALLALLEHEFAVVLLDVVMPGMDGFETAARIKRDRDVPIIFLTAAAAPPEQVFRGYAAGAVDYLAKPFDPRVLKAKVSVFVDLYLNRSQLIELSGRLAAIEETVTLLRGLPAVTGDDQAGKTAAALASRVGELRDAFDGLRGP